MARITPTELREVFDTDLSDSSLTVWIDMASSIVDDIEDKDSSISSGRLENIEKLLASHFASSQDQRIESTSRETASVSYQGNTNSMDLRGTKHGQAAIQLDPTGVLSSLGKPTASLSVPDVKEVD